MSQPASIVPAPIQTQQKTAPASASLGGLLQRKCACGQHTVAGGECEECRRKRENTLQRAAVSAAPVNGVPPIVHNVLNSPGQPLDAGTRAFMEPRFGFDFSRVKVHTDSRAAESAHAVNALAYTVGHNVVFGTGQYAPGTGEGKRLMAHELTHVVQQRDGASGPEEVGSRDDVYEQEAEESAATVLTGQTPKVRTAAASPLLQRQEDDLKLKKPTLQLPEPRRSLFPAGEEPGLHLFHLQEPKLGDAARRGEPATSQKRGSRKRTGTHSTTVRLPAPLAVHFPIPQLQFPRADRPDLLHLSPSFVENMLSKQSQTYLPQPQQSSEAPEHAQGKSADDDERPRIAPGISGEIERDLTEKETTTNLQFSLTWKNKNFMKPLLGGLLERAHEPVVTVQSSFNTPNLPGFSGSFKSFATQISIAALNAHVLKLYGKDLLEIALNTGLGVEVGKEGSVDLKGTIGVQPQLHVGTVKVGDLEIPDTDVTLYMSVNAEPTLHMRRTGDAKSGGEGILSFGQTVVVGVQAQF